MMGFIKGLDRNKIIRLIIIGCAIIVGICCRFSIYLLLFERNVPPPPKNIYVPPPPPASGGGVIDYVGYYGEVYKVESDEYAVIKNNSGIPVNLSGWRLNAGDVGQDFYFPSYVLNPGASCRVYTNEIHPETCGFSFGIGIAIWDNDGNCGYLYDNNWVLVDEYCY